MCRTWWGKPLKKSRADSSEPDEAPAPAAGVRVVLLADNAPIGRKGEEVTVAPDQAAKLVRQGNAERAGR